MSRPRWIVSLALASLIGCGGGAREVEVGRLSVESVHASSS